MVHDAGIRSGLFTTFYDYDRSPLFREQILVSDIGSAYLTNGIAVLITLLIPCFFVLFREITLALLLSLRQLFYWARRKIYHSETTEDEDTGFRRAQEQQHEEEDNTIFAKVVDQLKVPDDEDNPLKAVKKVGANINNRIRLEDDVDRPVGIWPAFLRYWEFVGNALKKLWNDPSLAFAVIIVIVFYLVLFAIGIYVAIISANLVDGTVVSSAAHLAGHWEMDSSSTDFLLGGASVIAENRQSRSWSYKKSCYGSTSDSSAACDTFYSRQLPIHPSSNQPCPFDGDACLLGAQSAYEVTTGLLDSNTLGVNAPAAKRFHFRRTMSCAPLKLENYVFPTGDDAYPAQWVYDYGTSLSGPFKEYTYITPREWKLVTVDIADVPKYQMGLSVFDPTDPVMTTFTPLPEFKAGSKTVTILFISTGGSHLHVSERDDPIFPAHAQDDSYVNPKTHESFWYNNSTQAGVLGCVDSHQICADPSETLCWDQSNSSAAMDHFSNDLERQRALYLVLVSLAGSNTWRTLNYVQADALNATTEVRRLIGIRLAREQWKIEVENIFAASLASIQTRVYDFARGTYAHQPSMIDRTPMLLQGSTSDVRAAVQVASMFKFRDRSYRNVSSFGVWGIVVLCIVVFLGSRRFSNAKRRAEVEESTGDGGYYDYLWAGILWESVFVRFGKWAGKWISYGAVASYNALSYGAAASYDASKGSWESWREWRERSRSAPLLEGPHEEDAAEITPRDDDY